MQGWQGSGGGQGGLCSHMLTLQIINHVFIHLSYVLSYTQSIFVGFVHCCFPSAFTIRQTNEYSWFHNKYLQCINIQSNSPILSFEVSALTFVSPPEISWVLIICPYSLPDYGWFLYICIFIPNILFGIYYVKWSRRMIF